MNINKKLEIIFSQEQEFPVSILCSTNDTDKIDLIKQIITPEFDLKNTIFLVPNYRARHVIAFHLSNDSTKIYVVDDLKVEDFLKQIEDINYSKTTVVIYDALKLDEDIFIEVTKRKWKEVVFTLTILNPSSEANRDLSDITDLFNHPPW